MRLVKRLHSRNVHSRRVEVLARHLAPLFPQGARILDVGCGDGLLASRIAAARSDLEIQGIDVLVRPQTHIPVTEFDGARIPFDDGTFDAVMLIDVLHHTESPVALLQEAARVAACTVLKDHTRNGLLAAPTLRFMDWVGNAAYGVALPYNYLSQTEWKRAFDESGLAIEFWTKNLRLYPIPADWLFGRSLHFVAKLVVSEPCDESRPVQPATA